MLFNSAPFLVFFPAVLVVNFLLPHRARGLWLLVTSLVFYMCWNPAYVLLMLTSILATYLCGRLIAWCRAARDAGKAGWIHDPRLYVGLCFTLNLGILFFFKYYTFAAESLVGLLSAWGVRWRPPAVDVLLPVGISFYTFQALGYTVDVYRGVLPAERNLLSYALFVSFFPQLVAGPIERSASLLNQLKRRRPFDPEQVKSGAMVMLWGYFQKMVIADRAAVLVDQVYGQPAAYGGGALLVATVLFAIQIYCDFGGYSAIALGAAKILGIDLMQNFRQPYLALSVSDFWRRWHISLSTWFRDYLYIPLGGNRKGVARKYLNTLITFLLSGLWHGANWTYVVWGGLNGLFQIAGDMKNRLFKRLRASWHGRAPIKRDCFSYRLFQRIVTFALICLSWVFFRAQSVQEALEILGKILTLNDPWVFFDGSLCAWGLSRLEWDILVCAIAALWAVDLAHERGISLRERLEKQNLLFRWAAYLFGVMIILLFGQYGVGFDAAQFIYFQF